MHVNVGPFRYQVKLVRGYIRYEGEECLGLCDNLAQRILISDVPPETQRVQVFFHELMHAWWYHFGVDCEDEEQVVDLVGVAMTDFLIQAVRTMRAAATAHAADAGDGSDAADGGDGSRVDLTHEPAEATGLTDGPMPVLRIHRGGAVRPRRRTAPPPFARPRRPRPPLAHLGERWATPHSVSVDSPTPAAVERDRSWTIRIYDPAGVATVDAPRRSLHMVRDMAKIAAAAAAAGAATASADRSASS